MFPIILQVGWLHALELMHHGYWATRHALGVFYATPAAPKPGPVVLEVTRTQMASLIRHGYECTHSVAQGWLCTPNQIP